MRVVVDTNVFVSAALKSTTAPALAVRLAAERGILLKSAASEAQLSGVLARPSIGRLVAPAALAWLTALMAAAEAVTIGERIVACRDSTDDLFLELAVSGRADFLVSGDADLLVLHPFRGIPILPPAVFLQIAA